MNAVDLLLALLILAAAWGGYHRGLISGGADLVALVASIVFAFVVYPRVVAFAEQQGWQWGVWAAPAAFVGAYFLAHLVLELVFSRLMKPVPPRAHAHRVNRALGVVPGAINGLIGATIVAMLLLSLPLSDAITKHVEESALANRFAEPAESLESKLRPIFNPAIDRTLTRLTVTPGSQESVKLPFKVKTTKPRPDLEADMLELVNRERRTNGLKPLEADPQGVEVSRAHSRDMFARGYFSHVTPDGTDPFERMRRGGLRFRAAGENLAFSRTLPMAHQGLMNSPGHRANILRPHFGRVAIGIVDGGRYGLMVTQTFRN